MYSSLFAIWFSIIVRVVSQTPSTFFVSPPAAGDQLFFAENEVYTIGSVFDVQWVTDLDAYNIFLWQQSLGIQTAAEGSGPVYTKIAGSDEEGGFSWTTTAQQFSLNQSNVFFLALSPAGSQDLDGATTSHYINLTAASDTAPSSSSSVSATLPSSIQSTSNSVPPATATVTLSPPSTPPPSQITPSPSSSSATKIGVGVGLGLGIPLLLLIGFSLVPRRHYKQFFAAKPPSYANSIDRDNVLMPNTQPYKNFVVEELPTSELGHHSDTATQHNAHAGAVELDGWQRRMTRGG
ncbi:hypothetical protein H2200_004767 [Cladophialophora chaetospira]|uniref:Mid2 domain-containing protein n=1 Tax=Cladophialophora chaetospira TaxID=386627 RepID=A0AA39CKG8_9EURO|nr:hypothetical protein H2200_004767 [Cladophialophora chaetospira]